MKNWLRNLFQQPEQQAEKSPAAQIPNRLESDLEEKNELQALRLERAEKQRAIEHMAQEIKRLREQQDEMIQITLHSQFEELYKEMAVPASQILTQSHLIEAQGKMVSAQDLLAVSRRMIRAMERHGVVFEYQVGETTRFDPAKHISLTPGQGIEPGHPVVVRFCGVTYKGKMIQKAIVEQEQKCPED